MRKQKTEILMPTGMVTLDEGETDSLINVVLGRCMESYKRWNKTKRADALRNFLEASLVLDRIMMQTGTKEEIETGRKLIAKCRSAAKEKYGKIA